MNAVDRAANESAGEVGAEQERCSDNSPTIHDRVRNALAVLLEAHELALDSERDAWDFAVEMGMLREQGLNNSTGRWLICKGYVAHAEDVTLRGMSRRVFEHHGGLNFSPRQCFVLTPAGVAFATRILKRAAPAAPRTLLAQQGPPAPVWDMDRHELSWCGRLVKCFKLPAPNQETILSVFQEEGWPARVDDPLSSCDEQDPKQRLHDTIKSLNRNQRNRLIRFRGDGTGEGVCWEAAAVRRDG